MDLSKLPKLSNTAAHDPTALPPPADVPPSQPLSSPEHRPVVPSTGGDAWIGVVVGVLLLLLSPRLFSYLLHVLFGRPFTWTFSAPKGAPLAYTQTVFFWGDLVLALFAVAMILESLLVAFARKARTFLIASGIVAVAALANLIYVVAMFGMYGLQVWSAVAVVAGAWIAMTDWRRYQTSAGLAAV